MNFKITLFLYFVFLSTWMLDFLLFLSDVELVSSISIFGSLNTERATVICSDSIWG